MAAILRIKNPETGEFEDIKALVGPQGPKGDTPPLSNIAPSSLGTASPGTATNASREDHVHPMPTANDVGALPVDGTAEDSSKLNGQEASYYATEQEVSQLKNDIGDEWASGTTYDVGNYCISGNRLYKCKTAHTAGSSFNVDYWDATIITRELSAQTKYSDIIKFDTNFMRSGTFTINRKGNILSIIGSTTLPFNWDNYSTVIKANGTLTENDNLIIYDLTDTKFLAVNKDRVYFTTTCAQNHILMFWGVFSG